MDQGEAGRVSRAGQKGCKGSEKKSGRAWGAGWTERGRKVMQSREDRVGRDRRERGVPVASSSQGGDGPAWRGLACSTVLLQPRE